MPDDTLSAVATAIHDDCHGWFAPSYGVTRQDMRDTARAAVQALHDAFADPGGWVILSALG